MRIVLQRVSQAMVRVDGEVVGRIGPGLCLLVGIAPSDEVGDVEAAVSKMVGLRIFADEEGKMNLSLADVDGEVLVVSQFTLMAEVKRGRRPSFTAAAPPEQAKALVDSMVEAFRSHGVETAQGAFGAKMDVELTNDGPITLVLDVAGGVVG